MPPWDKISSIWKNVQEVDLRPIRREAERHTAIAIVGSDNAARRALVRALSLDEQGNRPQASPALLSIGLAEAAQAATADLILVLVDGSARDSTAERALVNRWVAGGKKVLIFIDNRRPSSDLGPDAWLNWGTAQIAYGSVEERTSLVETLVPAATAMLSDRLLSLGRHFPLFRTPIAHQLINETCTSNAVYAFSTGIAEVVPFLDIPLNIADLVVLTKTQALLVYRLGLLLGLPTDWRYYLAEFGSVIGGGFLWRQAARQLVGLIPVWGIVPKVAVAYAGTYAVGHAVLRWHQTGRHLTRKEIGQLYRQAFAMGKSIAGDLAQRIPRPRRLGGKRRLLPKPRKKRICAHCNTHNDPDASFCKRCGHALEEGVPQ